MRIRKRTEETFGWQKPVNGVRKSRHIGRAKLAGKILLRCVAYNLVRVGNINGRWNAKHP
jgi:hypothetical protein